MTTCQIFPALIVLVLAGCGVSQTEYNIRVTEVEKCQSELGRTRDQLTTVRGNAEAARKELDERQDEVARLRADAAKLAGGLEATEKDMDTIRKRRVRAGEERELYRTLVQKLHDPIAAGALTVEVRKQKLTLRLDDGPLFDAGKATLKPEGQKTLGEVAQALKEIADRDLLVAGHTDNRPLKGATFSSNWELTAARAVQVVRFLQSEGLDPRRLAAAGYSEFDRVDDGETVESRAKNRRIEVVILPRADELPVIELDGVEPQGPATRSPAAPAPPTR